MIGEWIGMCSLSIQLLAWQLSFLSVLSPLTFFRWSSHSSEVLCNCGKYVQVEVKSQRVAWRFGERVRHQSFKASRIKALPISSKEQHNCRWTASCNTAQFGTVKSYSLSTKVVLSASASHGLIRVHVHGAALHHSPCGSTVTFCYHGSHHCCFMMQ